MSRPLPETGPTLQTPPFLDESLLPINLSPEEKAGYLGFISLIDSHLEPISETLASDLSEQESDASIELKETVFTPTPINKVTFYRHVDLRRYPRSHYRKYSLGFEAAESYFYGTDSSITLTQWDHNTPTVTYEHFPYTSSKLHKSANKAEIAKFLNGIVTASAALLGETIKNA